MAETPLSQDALTQDQKAHRRRARRRLVGAVAIALAAVLILPMLFDPEPRPLGPDVDIRIPAPSTPFVPAPAVVPALPAAPAADEPPAQAAEPTLPAAAHVPPVAETVSETATAKVEKGAAKTAAKPAEKAADRPDMKSPPLPLLKPSGAFASHGFYLQLGAFGSASNARLLQAKAAAAGFKVNMADSNGQYRVRVGPIPEKDRALEMQAKLKAKGFTSVMLGP